MNKLKQLSIWLLIITLPVFSYSQHTSEIIGKMKKAKGTMVYLQKVVKNKMVILDSSEVNFFGKFKLNTEVKEPNFYHLTTADNKNETQLLLLKGNEKIKIKTSKDFKDKSYSIKGSEDNDKIQKFRLGQLEYLRYH